MGLHHRSLRQLAPAHLVVAYGGHSIVRTKSRCTTPRQRALPYSERASSLRATGPDDARPRAKCDGRSAICMAPIARGIGGLDFRTQRCVEHIFCLVIAGSLRPIHGVETANPPSVLDLVLCGRINVEANAGDPSFHFLAARLLAAKAGLLPISPFASREVAVLLVDCSIEYCDVYGATKGRSGGNARKHPITVSRR